MGLFGDLDAKNLSTNPYFIEEDTYEGYIEKVEDDLYNEERDQHQVSFTYKIDDESSKYHGKTAREWFRVYPDLTSETLANLPGDQQAEVETNLGRLKKRLCGYKKKGEQVTSGLGVDEDEVNSFDIKELKGTRVKFGIKNYGDDNEGVAVQWVSLLND